METPTSTPAADERPVNPKLLLPKADPTLYDVAAAVNTHWADVPALSLLWLPRTQYGTYVADFGANLTEKRQLAADRSPQVMRLIELDDLADDALPYLKTYINEEAGSKKKGNAQYASFGMVLIGKKTKRMELADDRQERAKGVEMLLKKLKTGGANSTPLPYADRKYGTAFWQNWLNEYKPLVEKGGNDAGTISHKVSRKDEAKRNIVKALRAIIYLLKANYPDTFEAELRAWGFRKESY